MSPRRALVVASASRYLVMLLQIAATFVVARHVAPEQFGATVLGGGAFLIAEALRELGSTAYLVQQRDLSIQQIRTAFTVSLAVTAIVSVALYAAAAPIAGFYHSTVLAGYLHILVLGYAMGPFVHPITALLTRDMAFGSIAVIEVAAACVNAVASVVLVRTGLGFMGVAWAGVASGVTAMLLGFWFKREVSVFRPSLAAWRGVLSFGVHGSATAMTYRIGEAVLFLSLGRQLDTRAIGLLQRGYLLAQVPERVLLAGAGAVAMPAMAEAVRTGRRLEPLYLHSLALISGVFLPAMAGIILLARPIVDLLLGPDWMEVVPLTQIMAGGLLTAFATTFNTLALIAAGAISLTTPLALIQMVLLVVATWLASMHGVQAVAWTSFATAPACAIASVLFLQARVAVRWRDLLGAIRPSILAALASAAGPAAVAMATDWHTRHPAAAIAASVMLAAPSWLAALWLTRHPLFGELKHLAARVMSRWPRAAAR